MPTFFNDFVIPYYAVKCEEKMLNRHLEEMRKFFCQGVPDCVFDIRLKSCEANPNSAPTVGPLYFYNNINLLLLSLLYAIEALCNRKNLYFQCVLVTILQVDYLHSLPDVDEIYPFILLF